MKMVENEERIEHKTKNEKCGAVLKLMGDDEAERNGERAADVAVSVLCLYLGAMSPS